MQPIDFHEIRRTHHHALVAFFARPIERITDHDVALWVYLHAATFADRIAA